ncbi:MAG: hypothetical protein KME30_31205 [Iphinoe sp. HA4291-MV1]|jgi:hypothetical protein|nr:hypothetical protein [Iphinoe sp. HA4291-MV1]
MKQIMYIMQFDGQVSSAQDSSGLEVKTYAEGCVINTVISSNGVGSTIEPIPGAKATFESQVQLVGEASFQESGKITFGDSNHRLNFSSLKDGYIASSPDPKFKHGSITWNIDGGEGQFKNASGLITSNFILDDTSKVTEIHVGLIFVEE